MRSASQSTPMIHFNRTYFLLAIILLIIEILIALFVHDTFLRPYGGDTLAVLFLYCGIRSFLRSPYLPAALFAWLFACFLEMIQSTNLLFHLGLQKNELANILVGNTFAWLDILAYTAGLLIIVIMEKFLPGGQKSKYRNVAIKNIPGGI